VTLRGAEGTLAAGRWTARDLLGATSPPALTVGASGRFTGYAPLQTLAPLEGYVFDLARAR
jgi:hypothetical protein